MKKLMNKKGFTLMEMLIVIAIIVILVVIAVPTFSRQVSEAQNAANAANERAAKAVAAANYLVTGEGASGETWYYIVESGAFVNSTGVNVPTTTYVTVTYGEDGAVVSAEVTNISASGK